MKRKILYIINPKSGIKKNPELPVLIEEVSNQFGNDFLIERTVASKHATELSREAAKNGFDIVVAVGGDGSVNETAEGLIGTQATLGIIPTGSGNGLARHLKLPLAHKKAIEFINVGEKVLIDTFCINDHFCVGTFGIGFDGHIAHLFAKAGKRGYSTYVKLVLTEFYKYKPSEYNLLIDGRSIVRECFMLTIANSSQFGNNAVIAPFADIRDGILDISMMRKFPSVLAPYLIYHLMSNTIHKTLFFEMMKGKEILIKNNGILQGHIDGEPVTFDSDVHVKIKPASLNVIANL